MEFTALSSQKLKYDRIPEQNAGGGILYSADRNNLRLSATEVVPRLMRNVIRARRIRLGSRV